MNFEELVGKRILSAVVNDDSTEIHFEVVHEDGVIHKHKMWHEQDCCESVWLEDVVGDLADLQDAMVVSAEVETSDAIEIAESKKYYSPVEEWTFYKIQTDKGHVTLRWCGQDEGYYSKDVSFY